MEDIIALVLVVGVFALFVWGVVALIKRVKREKELEVERKIAAEKYWNDLRTNSVRAKVSDSMNEYVSTLNTTPSIKTPKPKKTETVRNYDTMTTTTRTSDSSDDGFLTGALVGYAVNSLLHSTESKSEERSVGVSSRESSWGFDDSDSRKSISSSMDWGSSSDSSSSSDSWSSSDSGPSSDW